MKTSVVSRGWIVLSFFVLIGVQPILAQDRFHVRARAGVAIPQDDMAGIFDPGPTFGVDVGYGIVEWADVMLNFEADIVSNYDTSTPLRLQVGAEGDILGGRVENFGVVPYVGLGFTRFSSQRFSTNASLNELDAPSKTYFTVSGGLRFAWDTGDGLALWIGGGMTHAGISDEDSAMLNNWDHQPKTEQDVDPDGSITATPVNPDAIQNTVLEFGISLSPWR